MLYVNVHEPAEIKEYLANRMEISVSNFTPGDYLIGNIAVERKTIADFLSSLVQGRLFEQLGRMKSCYPCCFLFLEAYDLTHFQKPRPIYGAILKIMLEMNIKVVFTQTKEQTAEVLLLLAGKKSSSTIKHKEKETSFPARQLDLLESVPLVGREKARQLISHFGSLENVFSADKTELRKVGKIGRKTAASIKKMWELEREK